MRFAPVPFQVVSEPAEIKACADPLRNRILHILADREATNQQLATSLGEPQAKVLHHVRVLLDAGLIRLVDQRIRGGNVEKFYRATARLYGFRPGPESAEPLPGSVVEAVTQEAVTVSFVFNPVLREMDETPLAAEETSSGRRVDADVVRRDDAETLPASTRGPSP